MGKVVPNTLIKIVSPDDPTGMEKILIKIYKKPNLKKINFSKYLFTKLLREKSLVTKIIQYKIFYQISLSTYRLCARNRSIINVFKLKKVRSNFF